METTRRHTLPADIADMLATARRRLGYPARETARAVGISHCHLLRLEAGTRAPSLTVAHAVADVLRLDPAQRARLVAAAIPDAGRDWPGRDAA